MCWVCWIDFVVHELKRCKIRVSPWLFRTKDIPDNNPDKRVAEICANVGRKILDVQVNLLPVGDPRKQVNRVSVLNLDVNIVSERGEGVWNVRCTHNSASIAMTKLELGDC